MTIHLYDDSFIWRFIYMTIHLYNDSWNVDNRLL